MPGSTKVEKALQAEAELFANLELKRNNDVTYSVLRAIRRKILYRITQWQSARFFLKKSVSSSFLSDDRSEILCPVNLSSKNAGLLKYYVRRKI